MDNLPIPKIRSSWVSALLITIATFALYYLMFFDVLFEVYENQFTTVYFEQSQHQVDVWASVPRYYNSSDPAWVYLYVKNKSDEPIYDLEVYMVVEASDSNTLLLPNLYDDKVYSSGASFEVLAPNYVTTARISFVAQEEPVVSKVLLIENGNDTREELDGLDPTLVVQMNKSNVRAFQHSFLENILLPPWSNGFILALVLFSVYLVRLGDDKDKKSEPSLFGREWWDLVWETSKKSVFVLLIIIIITMLFLLVNEITASPILCVFALIATWILGKIDIGKYVSNKMRANIYRVLFSFATSGLIFAVIVIGFRTLEIFFSDFNVVTWLPSSSGWVWFFVVITVASILYWKRQSEDFFTRTIAYWGFRFLTLSLLYISVSLSYIFFLDKSMDLDPTLIEEGVSWVVLALISFASLLYQQSIMYRVRNSREPTNH